MLAAAVAALQIGAQATPSVAVDIFNLGISPMFVGGMYVTVVRLLPQQWLPWQRKNGEEVPHPVPSLLIPCYTMPVF